MTDPASRATAPPARETWREALFNRRMLICVFTAMFTQAVSTESFDDVYRRLQKGREYTAQPTGLVRMSHRSADGVEYHFALNVPDGYDPLAALGF